MTPSDERLGYMPLIVDVAWGVGKHLAFGYLVYSLLEHRRGRSPGGAKTVVLLVGVMFPDLVDKPLVLLGVLEYGRSFAHSLFTASVIAGIVCLFAHRQGRFELGWIFGLGYLLHLPVDLYGPLLTGNNPIDTAFLFWPVAVEYPLGVMPPDIPVSKGTAFSVVMISAFGLWVYDGFPVVSEIARSLRVRLLI
jgi:membrane-bound metal-dependent hydrolase YbcI (DUF457 family)